MPRDKPLFVPQKTIKSFASLKQKKIALSLATNYFQPHHVYNYSSILRQHQQEIKFPKLFTRVLNSLPDNQQVIFLVACPYIFRLIKNPSPMIVMIIEFISGTTDLSEIINPSFSIQLAAVYVDGHNIRFVNDPPEILQIIAINQNPETIVYLTNPSHDVQLAAVQQDGRLIKEIIQCGIVPSPDVQLVAVQQNGDAIKFIENPSKQVELAAVEQNGLAIRFLTSPNDSQIALLYNLQLAEIRKDYKFITQIENPPLEFQLAAVEQEGEIIKDLIQYGIVLSEHVKLAAVRQNGNVIKYIKNPSKQICEVAFLHPKTTKNQKNRLRKRLKNYK